MTDPWKIGHAENGRDYPLSDRATGERIGVVQAAGCSPRSISEKDAMADFESLPPEELDAIVGGFVGLKPERYWYVSADGGASVAASTRSPTWPTLESLSEWLEKMHRINYLRGASVARALGAVRNAGRRLLSSGRTLHRWCGTPSQLC